MTLRNELRISDPDPALVERLEALCVQGINRVNTGADCEDVVDEIHSIIGGERLTRFDLHSIDGSNGPRFWAELVAMGEPPHVPDLSRDEVIAIVGLILNRASAPKSHYYLGLLERNAPHSAVSDLIYYPDRYWPEGYQPTPEEIADRAMDQSCVIRL